MAPRRDRFGLSCALATPFRTDGRVDLELFVSHARSRLELGCDSVTAFGTTGEGPSIGTEDRAACLAALGTAGFDFRRTVVIGCAAAAAADAAAQMRTALAHGCRAILLAPPFYFKGVREDALFDWFAACFAAVGPDLRDVILYHIPSVTAVPLPLTQIRRLKRAFPDVVYGVKDSGGDWTYSQALLEQNPDLTILIGDERHLARAVAIGAEGAIAGTANFMPAVLAELIRTGVADDRVVRIVDAILEHPATPAVKALLASVSGVPGWRRVAPPLTALTQREADALSEALRAALGSRERLQPA